MITLKKAAATALGLAASVAAVTAQAALSNSYQFNGKGNWSIDGVGGNNTPVGDIQAVVPTGSTVVKAFLYSTMFTSSTVPTVLLEGTTYSGADWTALGVNAGLQAYRADVTSQIAALIGGGSASTFNFTVEREEPNTSIDGEALVIVYSNPAEVERTIAVLDGFSASGGDSFAINLSDPITAANLADPGFEALMSLGIGFGFQPASQFSTVDINGQRLTSCAGGQDDGGGFNGGLITVGGLGDSPANPAPNCSDSAGPLVDDELYSLKPFLAAGDTVINGLTRNPSNNDNIFFSGLNITARGGVNQPPPDVDPDPNPTPVSEPGTLTLVGLGMALLGLQRRRRKA